MYYVYSAVTISGVDLKIIKTSPNNIQLTYLNGQSVPGSGKLGMNGGFFEDVPPSHPGGPYVYSIAVNDNVPINGTFADYGSGGTQSPARGTLVWDKTTRAYFIQVTTKGDEATLWVAWGDKYWAQGGISMNLQDDIGWHATAANEGMPVIDEQWYRSGLLYNDGLNIFLVVSTSICTAAEFRTACKGIETTMRDGIFLDGANAAQMNVPGTYSTPYTRQLAAMVEVVPNVVL